MKIGFFFDLTFLKKINIFRYNGTLLLIKHFSKIGKNDSVKISKDTGLVSLLLALNRRLPTR